MINIEEITKKHKVDLGSFDLAKANYYKDCIKTILDNPNEIVDKLDKSDLKDKAIKSFDSICGKLSEIILICGHEASVKENAEILWSTLKDVIPQVGFITEKTNINITIGLFRDFYITTKLNYTNNLSSMTDEFWQMLLRLTEIGLFKFTEDQKPSPVIRNKYPHLFNKRGGIYKLTRNYFLSQMEYGHCNSLGYLNVQWDNETSFEKLILNYCETFKIMYKLNYMLWKEELKNKEIK